MTKSLAEGAAMQLNESEMREVLARAQEIDAHGEQGESASYEPLVAAAHEVGISREAITLALKERFQAVGHEPKPGDLVFARSMDEHFYVARLVSRDGIHSVVQFLNGGERTLPTADTRPCQLFPGSKVLVDWPGWGWWTATIVSFNAEKMTLDATDGWSNAKTFPVANIRLGSERKAKPLTVTAAYWISAAAALAAGIGGFLIGRFAG